MSDTLLLWQEGESSQRHRKATCLFILAILIPSMVLGLSVLIPLALGEVRSFYRAEWGLFILVAFVCLYALLQLGRDQLHKGAALSISKGRFSIYRHHQIPSSAITRVHIKGRWFSVQWVDQGRTRMGTFKLTLAEIAILRQIVTYECPHLTVE